MWISSHAVAEVEAGNGAGTERLRNRARSAPARPSVLVYGVLSGWLILLLLFAHGVFAFRPIAPPAGILNYCFRIGYPKQQDYFWYAAAIMAAWGGAFLVPLLRSWLADAGWRGRWPRRPSQAGLLLIVTAMLMALSRAFGSAPVTILIGLAGIVLPWFESNWFVPEEVGADGGEGAPPPGGIFAWPWWAIGSVVLAAVWAFDACIAYRIIDGKHEGHHLLYLQGYLAGDMPGVATRTVYSPLYVYTFIWWMKAAGMTMLAGRWYFYIAQALGLAVHIAVLRLFCSTRTAVVAGVWLMLTVTTAPYIQYGWANALRTALPAAAVVVFWRATINRRFASGLLAGVALGTGFTYSQEYAVAGALACGTLLLVELMRSGSAVARPAAGLGAGAFASAALVLAGIFGRDLGTALRAAMSGGFAASHLLGHAVHPFPPIPGIEHIRDPAYVRHLSWVLSLWWPGLLAGAGGAWLIGRKRAALARPGGDGTASLAAALVVLTLLYQVPALLRPLGQIGSSAPGAVLLAALLLDMMRRGRGSVKAPAAAFSAFLFVYGMAHAWSMLGIIASKAVCVLVDRPAVGHRIARLGGLDLPREQEARISLLVDRIRKECPPGRRVYQAAAETSYLCFLADRTPLAPYPSGLLAATASQRAEVIAALERERPPLALVAAEGVDVPYEEEHSEEWAYLNRHYRMKEEIGGLMFFVLRK